MLKPDFPHTSSSQRSVTIRESQDYFQQKSYSTHANFTVNQNDWAGLTPVWTAANEVVLNDLSTVVMVPIDDSTIVVNPYLDAYVVFFEDSLAQIQMHVLFFQADTTQYAQDSFPTMANFSGLIWEFYDEEDTYRITVVENGVISGCGCSSVFSDYLTNIDSLSIQPRKDPACYSWKENIWDKIGTAGGNLWKGIGKFFRSISLSGGSGNVSGSGSSNGSSGTGSGSGTGGNGFDGFGGFGFGGNGGGGGNSAILNLSSVFTEWQIKQLQKAAIWMNGKYGTSLSVVGLLGMMDISCVWEISDFVQNPSGPAIDEEDEGPSCALAFYIGSVLGLTNAEIECISGNISVMTELENIIKSGEVIDVCDPARQKEEILREGVSSACSNNQLNSINDIYDGFGVNDKIIVFHNLVDFCPVYDCILNEMISGPAGTGFVCQLFSGFDNNSQQVLQFRPVDFAANGLNSQAFAATVYVESKVQILININNCSTTSPIVAFETIQHELLHADINRRLLEDHNWEAANESFEDAFFKLVYFEYGPNASFSEHEFMLDFYLDQMIQSLVEYNNGVGAEEDFIGLVYFGFPADVLFYNNITVSQALSLYSDYQNFISSPGKINHTFSNCD